MSAEATKAVSHKRISLSTALHHIRSTGSKATEPAALASMALQANKATSEPDELVSLRKELAQLRQTTLEQQTEIESLKAENTNLKSGQDGMVSEVVKLWDDIRALRQTNQAQQKQLVCLKMQLKQQEAAVECAYRQLDNAESWSDALQSEYQALVTRFKHLAMTARLPATGAQEAAQQPAGPGAHGVAKAGNDSKGPLALHLTQLPFGTVEGSENSPSTWGDQNTDSSSSEVDSMGVLRPIRTRMD